MQKVWTNYFVVVIWIVTSIVKGYSFLPQQQMMGGMKKKKPKSELNTGIRNQQQLTERWVIGWRAITRPPFTPLSHSPMGTEAEEQEPDCLCAILKPEPFDVVNGGSYRCVRPQTLLSSLKKVEGIMQREGFLWTKIKFGLELTQVHFKLIKTD